MTLAELQERFGFRFGYAWADALIEGSFGAGDDGELSASCVFVDKNGSLFKFRSFETESLELSLIHISEPTRPY